MTDDEQHQREMNMNAHIAWAFALLGSAEVANERGNSLSAAITYYYSSFHAGFALINTDHTFQMESMQRIRHSKVESWLENRLPIKLHEQYVLLRNLREAVNYLGMESPASKLHVVRGHPFGFDIKTLTISKRLTFFEMLKFAGESSTAIIAFILGEIEKHCQQEGLRGPKRGNDEWLTEYIQEDFS